MKKLIGIFVFVMFMGSCSKDADRRSGVCYCEFFKGDPQEYDLSNLTRAEQESACNVHDNNANNFGGECELE